MSYHICTVHIVTGLNENADLEEWTTFDDHGRPAKKWAPLDGPSAGCSMLLYTRTDLLDGLTDLGCAFKSQDSKDVLVRIMQKCEYTNPGIPRGGAVDSSQKKKRKRGLKKDLASAVVMKKDLVASIKSDFTKLQNKIDQL